MIYPFRNGNLSKFHLRSSFKHSAKGEDPFWRVDISIFPAQAHNESE